MYLAGLRELSFKGVAKPHPFVKFKGYGTFMDFIVKDSPAQAISVGTTGGSAVFSDVLVDNKDGDTDSLGHNTDGFDVSASDVTITGSTVYNQDDCVAINSVSLLYSDASERHLCALTGLEPRLREQLLLWRSRYLNWLYLRLEDRLRRYDLWQHCRCLHVWHAHQGRQVCVAILNTIDLR